MSIAFKFNNTSMDLIMYTARKFQLKPSEAVDELLDNPELLKKVTNEISEQREDRERIQI